MSITERMHALVKQIHKHRRQYYVLNQPIISDAEYDALEQELIKLESEYPDLIDPNSPTQRIGNTPLDSFNKVQHLTPMLSLDNTYSKEELVDWELRVKKVIPNDTLNFAAELKIDGISLSLVYENHILIKASTRGNGEIGEDVTENAKTISDIPITLPKFAPPNLEVRGEVFLSRIRWEALNKKRAELNEPLFANTRNAAAGTMRQLDSRITASRLLSFLPWQYIGAPSHYEAMNQLVSFGFNHIPANVFGNFQKILNFIEKQREKRFLFPFDCDGVVIKIDSLALQNQLGCTNRVPRWAIAFKYPSLQATTTLLGITWQVGRTGKLTPVAELKPVSIAGSMIRRATLHNADELERLKLRIGCRIFLEKGGDVIPKVISIVPDSIPLGAPKIEVPTKCPVCSGLVSKDSDSDVAWRCQNSECPAKLIARLIHLGSRQALDIEGLGEALAEQLANEQWIVQPWDIFHLLDNQKQSLIYLASLNRMGQKSAKNLLAAISKALTKPLSNWFYAFGIPMVGVRTAELLAQAFPDETLYLFWTAKIADLLNVTEVGPKVADAIKDFTKRHPDLPQQLIAMGVTPQLPEQEKNSHMLPLFNQVIVITGTLSTMNRSEAELLLKQMGAKITNKVSTKTTILIAGDKAGTKLTQAKKLGIQIKDENWLKMQTNNIS